MKNSMVLKIKFILNTVDSSPDLKKNAEALREKKFMGYAFLKYLVNYGQLFSILEVVFHNTYALCPQWKTEPINLVYSLTTTTVRHVPMISLSFKVLLVLLFCLNNTGGTL